MMMNTRIGSAYGQAATIVLSLALLALAACGSKDSGGGDATRNSGRGGRMGMDSASSAAAVPVQVRAVERRTIAQFLETNGTLEAENEVDLVARTVGPITELLVEEGDTVRKGQLLARIDEREARNQVAIATVNRDEAKLAFERIKTSWSSGLVSQEAYDSTLSKLQGAEAQLGSAQIQLGSTEIRAPFDALVVTRYIRQAQHVTSGTPLFRVSDFTPLLCPIEVPERDLPRIRVGQPARIRVEAYREDTFSAKVLRIRPTVDATTGTLTVTLEVDGRGKLRPGMFASIFLQTDTHPNALVIPRAALVLDSIGDTVFVRDGDIAVRREVRLGFREEDSVEVLEGLEESEELIVLGQDGLADGTPIALLEEPTKVSKGPAGERPGGTAPRGGEPSSERIESMRQRMKERGMSDAQIEERLARMREGGGPRPSGGEGATGAGGSFAAQGIPPFMAERIRKASPEDLEGIKERMRQFGLSDERIDEVVKSIRGGDGE